MLIGSDNGKLIFFNNTSGAGNPANFPVPTANYMGIDIGNTSTPQIVDLNRDGLLDLVVGTKNGVLKYFQNAGTSTSPFFNSVPTIDTLGGIDLHVIATPDGYTVPFFYTQMGQYHLLVSCEKGDVYHYTGIDGNISGHFILSDTIISGTLGTRNRFNLSVSGGDLNNDGLTDMLVGLYTGGVQVYMQNQPTSVHELRSLNATNFETMPNPADGNCSVHLTNYNPSEQYQFNLMNYQGQPIFSKTIHSNNFILVTRDFPSGVYLLQLRSPQTVVTRKIIILH
jgi:hypothetical protein